MRVLVALLLLATLVSSCARPAEHKYTLYVFGTLVELTLYGVSKEMSDKSVALISHGFQQRHKDWHAWKAGKLGTLNTAIANGVPHKIDNDMAALLDQARDFERMSHGLFNPAISKLIALWGFHSSDKPEGPPPDKQLIRELIKARPSMQDLTIKSGVVSSRNKAVQLDFGGFAKGVALDWAAQLLQRHGIKNAVLNAGGDLNIIGRYGSRLWRAGIRHPRHWGVIATVDLQPGEALYTSGNYFRFKEHEGKRYSHILDPRTGWPVDHIISATVIHKNSALADAGATALSVAGPTAWVETARNMGLAQILLVDKNGGLYMTPKMQRRLVLSDAKSEIIAVIDPFALGSRKKMRTFQ
ncbi:MAG: FAD:protein FMN transferase [bacterium]|nr:FAD:protein FMN transferase [bacterium]